MIRSEIRPRIIGSELENSISILNDDGGTLHKSLGCKSEFTTDYLPTGVSSLSYMLSNGGRFYPDVGFAEYCTPEELGFREFVAREFAGERIVMESLIGYMRDEPDIREAYIRKRVIDDWQNTWGYHVNLSADITRIPDLSVDTMHLLALHIATSQPLLGSGAVISGRNAGNRIYSFGQKVLDPRIVDFGLHTHNETAIINLRDEPLANKQLYRRVHITCADPHISPWASMMVPGTHSLVLRAMEQGKGSDIRAELQNARSFVGIARTAATDLTFKQTVTMQSGESMTPLDIQYALLAAASQTEHTEDEAMILREWKSALEDLETNPMLLRDRSDAIARWSLIRSLNTKVGNDPNGMSTDEARKVDNYYDRIFEIGTERAPRDADNPLRAYYNSHAAKLRSQQMARFMPSEAMIDDAIYNPPKMTRAYGRAAIINSGDASSVSWDRYVIGSNTSLMLDPYRTMPLDWPSTPLK